MGAAAGHRQARTVGWPPVVRHDRRQPRGIASRPVGHRRATTVHSRASVRGVSCYVRAMADLEIELFFDIGSSYSYLAASQMEGLAARTGVPIRWRPFLLGAVFKATGN